MVDISFRMKYTNEPCSSIYERIKDTIPVTLNAIKNIKQRKRYLKYTDCVEFELSDILIRCLDLAALRGISLQYVDEFLAGGVNAITDPFPIVMYHLCEELTLYKECLCEKLNVVIALIIAYCRQNGIDIDFFVEQKMRFNKFRDYKHGNKKY